MYEMYLCCFDKNVSVILSPLTFFLKQQRYILMEWGKVILVEVYERILRCWLYGRSIWMNFALLNAFNIYCVTLTGILRQKCSVMILIWIHRWLFCWFRLRYPTFWWVFLCSVISGLNKNYVDPGRPLSVRQCVCVCLSVCLCVCHSLSFPQILADVDENLTT